MAEENFTETTTLYRELQKLRNVKRGRNTFFPRMNPQIGYPITSDQP